VDTSGYIYVADSYNNRIQKFSASGEYITQWGSFGTGNGQFKIPYGIAVDASGNVYVADTVNNRIQKFSLGSSDENKASCYIATAAYGSYLDPHVWVLRDFRDKYLATYSAGRVLLDIYYRHSPPIADFIRDKEGLKWVVRLVIAPLVYAIEYPFAAIFMLFPPAFLLFRKWRKFFIFYKK
jgi:hypothetical protein